MVGAGVEGTSMERSHAASSGSRSPPSFLLWVSQSVRDRRGARVARFADGLAETVAPQPGKVPIRTRRPNRRPSPQCLSRVSLLKEIKSVCFDTRSEMLIPRSCCPRKLCKMRFLSEMLRTKELASCRGETPAQTWRYGERATFLAMAVGGLSRLV